MAAWLSEDWARRVVDALAGWPAPASAGDATPAPVELQVTVLGAADGDVSGRVLLWADGEGAQREASLTLPDADARAVVAGELAPSVAYMRGRMKTAGDPGAVLEVLGATATPAWEQARQRVAAATDAG